MSAIYINGEPVVQSNFPEMTLAQYNALPEAEKPEFWVRTDASYDNIPGTAVTFDNEGTTIESTDVDGAIKEVDEKVNDIGNLPIVSFEDWNAMTEQEQEAYKASHYRFGVEQPDTSGVINAEYMKLLWENPNTSQAFAAQTITLNSADYDFSLWIYEFNTSGTFTSKIVPKGKTSILDYASGAYFTNRTVTYVSDTSYSVGGGSYYLNGQTFTNDAFNIPIAVYGIKSSFQFKVNAIATELSTRADHCFLSDDVTSVEDALKVTYSTSERKIGTWIDGSDLYEKTIDCGGLVNSTSKTVAHGISNFKRMISVDGRAWSSDGIYEMTFAPTYRYSNGYITAYVNTTNVVIIMNENFTIYTSCYVTVRYTKTS